MSRQSIFNIKPDSGDGEPEFYLRPKQNEDRTKAEGRPIFEMREYMRKQTPGDKDSIVDRPVTEADKVLYQSRYTRFKAGQSQNSDSGTPLSAWGGLPPEEVASCRATAGIHTVEQLAGLSDGILQNFPPGYLKWRQAAQDFIKAAKSQSHVMQMRAELDEKDARITALEQMVRKLNTKLDELADGNGSPAGLMAVEPEAPRRRRKENEVTT